MNYKTEKMLMLIAGIFSIITLILGIIGYYLITLLQQSSSIRSQEWFKTLFDSGEVIDRIPTIRILFSIIILLIVSIAFFVLRNKLTVDNHQVIAVILISIALLYIFNITGIVESALSLIAGIMIAFNTKKYLEINQ